MARFQESQKSRDRYRERYYRSLSRAKSLPLSLFLEIGISDSAASLEGGSGACVENIFRFFP